MRAPPRKRHPRANAPPPPGVKARAHEARPAAKGAKSVPPPADDDEPIPLVSRSRKSDAGQPPSTLPAPPPKRGAELSETLPAPTRPGAPAKPPPPKGAGAHAAKALPATSGAHPVKAREARDPRGSTPEIDPRAEALLGRVLSDRYRVDTLIGRGAMGAVFRGRHLLMKKAIAIKVLHPETESFPELVTRFRREAIAGAHISHPNVALASDLGQFDEGAYFLILEYVKGRTLRSLIDEGPMPPERAASIAAQLAAGLGAAHDKGIVHRDVKPRNVMVTELDSGVDVVKLIDFGFARVPVSELSNDSDPEETHPPNASISESGVVFGTVEYMAPEAALGMRAVGPQSDLYAVGVIFYELLTGRHPFDTSDPKRLFRQHRTAEPPPMAERNPDVDVPPELEALVMRLLAKEPDERYPGAAAVVEAIEEAMPGSTMTSTPSSRRARDSELPLRRGRRSDDRRSLDPRDSRGPDSRSDEARLVDSRAAERKRRSQMSRSTFALVGVAIVVVIGYLYFAKPQGPSAETEPYPVAEDSADVDVDAADTNAPTATATATATQPPAPLPDAVMRALKQDVVRAAESNDAGAAAAALTALGNADEDALSDPALYAAALKIAKFVGEIRTGEEGNPETNSAFYALSYKLGSRGLDVLYDVTLLGPTSRAARRAIAILELQAVTERASPALRIAWKISRTPCQEKSLLFKRAAAEGDARAAYLLQRISTPRCEPSEAGQKRRCCFKKRPDLEAAIQAIKQREAQK